MNENTDKQDVGLSEGSYFKYRGDLVSGRQAAIQDYDKAIVAVTTILLGLSLTLSGRATDGGPAWLLLTSWILLLLNITCTVVSLIVGHYSFDIQLMNLDRNKDLPHSDWTWPNRLAAVTTALNVASVTLFVTGVSFLIAASYFSLS